MVLNPKYHPAWLKCWPEKAWLLVQALTDEALKGDALAQEMLPWWINHALEGACPSVPQFSDFYTQQERERMDNG